jgi:uncharacterized membrane protein YfcA
MSVLVSMVLLLLVIGAVAGVMAGLLGVGGGIVLVPGFYYAFSALGYESAGLMQICLGTSLATIIVTSIRSVLAHHRKGAVEWAILRSWAPGIGIGALIGVLAVSNLRSDALQAIFGALAMIIAIYMIFGKLSWRLGEAMPQGPLRWVFSHLVGFFSVLMGIGGGSFGVPLMTLFNVPVHRAVATAAGFGALIAIPAVVGLLIVPVETSLPYTVGAINLAAFLLIITMTMLTAPLGAELAHRLNPKPLKRAFGVFLCVVGANMLRQAFGG